MLKIGEFSKMSKLTVKALRHYEAKGILIPAQIDKDNGFRYYDAQQLQLASLIKSLRSLDFSIDEIRKVLEGANLTQLLSKKAEELTKQKQSIEASLQIINNYLEEEKMKYEVKEKQIPEMLVYSAETTLDKYSDIMQWIPSLGQRCLELNPGIECAEPHYEFCEFLDCEYRESDIHVRHSEAVKTTGKEDDVIKFRTVPAAKMLTVYHVGPYDSIGDAYSFIVNYAEDHGFKIAGVPRECYIDGV